jgi:UDP-N-acetylglucosamine diphosphorylase / glucose-1-phosphate thymidylyltransferase / UDP-N-acetylgalactosamine diphosphorylase / glucosamine-1-phosphate N-acetyltransferase / galactosamine-1-phosphate N-acetyltransferase
MNWIFPIAGKGKRVKKLAKFKPFLEIDKKKIIQLFFENIKHKINNKDILYFITTNEFEKKFNVKENLKKILLNIKINNKIHVKLVSKTPKGPAITVKNILKRLKDNNNSCIIVNTDQIIDFELPQNIKKNKIYVCIYFNNTNSSSYVRLDENNKITNIEEKKIISYFASSGVYIFGSVKILKYCYDKYNFNIIKNEVNMSNIINNFLVKFNKKAEPLKTYLKYDLGNINSVKYYSKLLNNQKNNKD